MKMTCVRSVVNNIYRGINYTIAPAFSLRQSFSKCQRLAVTFSHPPIPHISVQRCNFTLISDAKAKPVQTRLPRNYEIESPYIWVVDESSQMTGPHRTYNVLQDFDFAKNTLVTVAEGNLDDEENPVYPICRIYDRASVRKKEITILEKKKQKKAAPKKTIEISWAVGMHDLDTKLRRLKEFLLKGFKVKILLLAKKRAKPVTLEEAELIIQKLQGVVIEAGAREIRAAEGEILDSMEMNFEGKKKLSENEPKSQTDS